MAVKSVNQGRSAIVALVLSLVFFFLGNRYGEQVSASRKPLFDNLVEGLENLAPSISDDPFHINTGVESLVVGAIFFLTVWILWAKYLSMAGNYRYGEESGSAKWGTEKEGLRFKDGKNEDNNILLTDKYGLALKHEKFNIEVDRNLNVLVIGGSGSGKTRNYVKPNLMQLNTSYFVTDPKGTLIEETGYLFRDNGYKIKSFNTINFDESLHYNPLQYVKTDADILSFVNCLIQNTNPPNASGSDPFWENSERFLYASLIALLRDWFPEKDHSLSGLLMLLSMAEAREDQEDFKSPLDLIFLQIEEGRKYRQNRPDKEQDSITFMYEVGSIRWVWVPSSFEHNTTGIRPADVGGLDESEDLALRCYKTFKKLPSETQKSIIASCSMRLILNEMQDSQEPSKGGEAMGGAM